MVKGRPTNGSCGYLSTQLSPSSRPMGGVCHQTGEWGVDQSGAGCDMDCDKWTQIRGAEITIITVTRGETQGPEQRSTTINFNNPAQDKSPGGIPPIHQLNSVLLRPGIRGFWHSGGCQCQEQENDSRSRPLKAEPGLLFKFNRA